MPSANTHAPHPLSSRSCLHLSAVLSPSPPLPAHPAYLTPSPSPWNGRAIGAPAGPLDPWVQQLMRQPEQHTAAYSSPPHHAVCVYGYVYFTPALPLADRSLGVSRVRSCCTASCAPPVPPCPPCRHCATGMHQDRTDSGGTAGPCMRPQPSASLPAALRAPCASLAPTAGPSALSLDVQPSTVACPMGARGGTATSVGGSSPPAGHGVGYMALRGLQ